MTRTMVILGVLIVLSVFASACSASTPTEGEVFGIVTEVTGEMSADM